MGIEKKSFLFGMDESERQYPLSKEYACIRFDVVLKEIKPLCISRWRMSCVYTFLSCSQL